MLRRCVQAFDGIDILVAAAGVGNPRPPQAGLDRPHTVLDVSTEQFRRVIDVNLSGVLFSNRAVVGWLVANRRPGSSPRSCRGCPRRAAPTA